MDRAWDRGGARLEIGVGLGLGLGGARARGG